MSKRIYISGPISGIPENNKHSFVAAQHCLHLAGHSAWNPFDNGLPALATWEEHMRADIRMMLGCNGVAMLPGWESSRGAKIERQLALDIGIEVRALEDWLV